MHFNSIIWSIKRENTLPGTTEKLALPTSNTENAFNQSNQTTAKTRERHSNSSKQITIGRQLFLSSKNAMTIPPTPRKNNIHSMFIDQRSLTQSVCLEVTSTRRNSYFQPNDKASESRFKSRQNRSLNGFNQTRALLFNVNTSLAEKPDTLGKEAKIKQKSDIRGRRMFA